MVLLRFRQDASGNVLRHVAVRTRLCAWAPGVPRWGGDTWVELQLRLTPANDSSAVCSPFTRFRLLHALPATCRLCTALSARSALS